MCIRDRFYPTVLFEQYDGLANKFRPYIVGGAGFFHFNPKSEYNEPGGTKRMVELKPLRLEGQGFAEYPDRKEYSLIQKELLFGGGVKYYLNESMYVGFEVLHRKTFTDYIDDVSTKYINPALFNTYLPAADAAIARQLYYRENLLQPGQSRPNPVSYTHLRAHETVLDLVCRLLLEKIKQQTIISVSRYINIISKQPHH